MQRVCTRCAGLRLCIMASLLQAFKFDDARSSTPALRDNARDQRDACSGRAGAEVDATLSPPSICLCSTRLLDRCIHLFYTFSTAFPGFTRICILIETTWQHRDICSSHKHIPASLDLHSILDAPFLHKTLRTVERHKLHVSLSTHNVPDCTGIIPSRTRPRGTIVDPMEWSLESYSS